jgi:hypothetical protein
LRCGAITAASAATTASTSASASSTTAATLGAVTACRRKRWDIATALLAEGQSHSGKNHRRDYSNAYPSSFHQSTPLLNFSDSYHNLKPTRAGSFLDIFWILTLFRWEAR